MEKTYATLIKLLLYLLLWFHVLACYWWIIVGMNSNIQFTKKLYGIPDLDLNFCLYAYEEKVFKIPGTDKPLPCDDRDSKWLPGPTYNDKLWERYTDTDRPFGYAWFTAGAMPWDVQNEYWEETPKGWIAPLNMANWPD